MLDFSVRALEVFHAVAKHRSFTTAADEMYISQSSVSKIIARFESTLQVQLFQRSSHGVELTPAGEYLYKELDGLLPQMQSLFQDLSTIGCQIKEHLCLSMPTSICKRLIKAFTSAYPNIRFTTSQSYDPFVSFHALMSNDASLWITHSLLIPEDYKKHIKENHIYADPVFAVLPADHPLANHEFLSIRDLADEKIICHSGHTLALAKALSINTGVTLKALDMRDSINTRAMCLVEICSGRGISLFYKSDFEMISSDKVVSIPLTEGTCCAVVAIHEKNRKLEDHEINLLNFFTHHWNNY